MVCSIEILERMMDLLRLAVLRLGIIGQFVAMAGNQAVSYVRRFTMNSPIADLVPGVQQLTAQSAVVFVSGYFSESPLSVEF
ncbi:hypothetical protein [Stutzerimonas stutzeri]|jgi:hypothetical protein|uniref:hypothetical protein n=1 Tax=Stutzerimonas stutzeri TaxID=316 RepID=UPI00036DA42E|nr:hypothetical protein [Stutzerimonas stutzeri]OCX56894.1 hypothetical protein BFM99_12550 [Stutzerimonas stutzeri]